MPSISTEMLPSIHQVHLAVKTPDQVPLHPLEEILRAEKNLHSAVAEAQEWAIPLGGSADSSNVASDSSVYTKNLGGGSFVDPFKFRNE